MSKTFSVLKREYLTRVKTKGFIIGTIMMPVFMVLIMIIPALFTMIKSDKQRTVVVIDLLERVFEPLNQALSESEKMDTGEPLYILKEIELNTEELDHEKDRLSTQVEDGRLFAFLIIPSDVFEQNQVEFYAKNVSSFIVNEMFRDKISRVISEIRLNESGLDPLEIRKLIKRTRLKTFRVGPEGSKEESSELAFIVSYGLVLFLYMSLLLYGQFVMRSVIEDKNSRVIEVVVSSMRSSQLMAGKILGVGAAGLTQFLIWALVAWAVSAYGLLMVKPFVPTATEIPIPSISVAVLGFFVLFFVLGYILYSGLYAAMGAMVNTESEAQSMQWPVMSLLILALMMMFMVINNPDSTLAVVLSMIPFFAPIIMFLRISVQAAPPIEIVSCIALMLITIWGLIWLSGKIFRVGILMYGKRPNLPELLKWVRYK